MRIGILVESFPNISEAWLSNQIIELLKRGVDVQIFSIYRNREELVHEQVQVWKLLEKTHYFFYPSGNIFKKTFSTILHLFRSKRHLGFNKFVRVVRSIGQSSLEPLFLYNYLTISKFLEIDILHAHFGEIGVIASKMKSAGLIPDTKLIVSFHGHDLFPYKKRYYKEIYQIFNSTVSCLLVNSLYSRELLLDLFKGEVPISVLPLGIDTDFFNPSFEHLKTREIRIVFVGRFVYLKGAISMVDIFDRIHERYPEARLIMIGDGEEQSSVVNTIGELMLKHVVELKGAMTQGGVRDVMISSDIFIFPGRTDIVFQGADTQGVVVQEAQAAGLPVVCADIGGIRYGMIDGQTGFLIPENDIEKFVEVISHLIENPSLRMKMSEAAREYVVENFDANLICDRLMEIYNTVLGK
ncbi:MAG: glycosyltransferase [Anditalea sp.]